MFAASGGSPQSQIMPKTETNGSEAIKAPKPGYRFASVEARAIRMPEMEAFAASYSIDAPYRPCLIALAHSGRAKIILHQTTTFRRMSAFAQLRR